MTDRNRTPVNRFGQIDRQRLLTGAEDLLRQVSLERIKPRSPLAGLSLAQQQMVEIAKVLSLNSRLIIFDEPTAALTGTETRALFEVITRLKQAGVGIIYASEDRKEAGLLSEMSVAQNVVGAKLITFGSWWFDDRRVRLGEVGPRRQVLAAR